MIDSAATCTAVLGLDVGKFSHWACLVDRSGEILPNEPVPNAEGDLDSLFGRAGEGALVVVDQVRNIGSLAISRARRAGLPVAYLPGLVAREASKLFAGDTKTDERDALVIAKTALGIPEALLIFSCNSLAKSRSRFGDYYRKCRDRGMCHGEALKAVARKRMKVIYAIMRDKVPYAA